MQGFNGFESNDNFKDNEKFYSNEKEFKYEPFEENENLSGYGESYFNEKIDSKPQRELTKEELLTPETRDKALRESESFMALYAMSEAIKTTIRKSSMEDDQQKKYIDSLVRVDELCEMKVRMEKNPDLSKEKDFISSMTAQVSVMLALKDIVDKKK